MKRNFLFQVAVWLMLCVSGTIYAQDTIYTVKHQKIVAKILTVTDSDVVYKLHNYLDGPDFVLSQKRIEKIVMKTGDVLSFGHSAEEVPQYRAEEMSPQTSLSPTPNPLDEENSVEVPFFRRYRDKKNYYRNRYYISNYNDMYNPVAAGVASFFLPGLGQMISGEVGRGGAFFGAAAGFSILTTTGFVGMLGSGSYYTLSGEYNSSNITGASTIFTIGVIGYLSTWIWSIVDATEVAKVNNLYQRDLRRQGGVKLHVMPYINQHSMPLGNQSTDLGLSLQVNF